MIFGSFRLGGDVFEAIIKGNSVIFRDTSSNQMTTIDGMNINKAGALKENPDLENEKDWKRITRERFKEHIKKFKTEKARLDYIKAELTKYGYTALFYQRAGHRPKQWRD